MMVVRKPEGIQTKKSAFPMQESARSSIVGQNVSLCRACGNRRRVQREGDAFPSVWSKPGMGPGPHGRDAVGRAAVRRPSGRGGTSAGSAGRTSQEYTSLAVWQGMRRSSQKNREEEAFVSQGMTALFFHERRKGGPVEETVRRAGLHLKEELPRHSEGEHIRPELTPHGLAS